MKVKATVGNTYRCWVWTSRRQQRWVHWWISSRSDIAACIIPRKLDTTSFIEVLSLHCACPGIAREGNNKHVICCDCLKRHCSTWHALQLSSSLFTWSVPLSQQCNIHVSLILSWMMKLNDCQLTHYIITCENPQTNERMSCQRDFDMELTCEYLLNPMCDKESDLL